MSTQQNNPYTTIFVTGGTGFVGSYVIRDLVNAGYNVKALRRKASFPAYIDPAIFQKVEWIQGDLLDITGLEDALEGVDAIIHSAAKVSFHDKDRNDVFATNIEGTSNLVNAAIEKKIKRFVHVSSVAAFGKRNHHTIVDEKQQWEENKLNTSYAVSKYQSEMEVWRGIAEGLKGVIVNPSTILGYGDWNSSSCALFKNAYKGFRWYTNGRNGFVDVEDVSRAIVQLLPTGIHSERFILNGENWSYKKLLETLAKGFGKKPPANHATPLIGAIAWRLELLRSWFTNGKRLITRESARIAQGSAEFDNRKILSTLPGFAFTPLEETINKACKSYVR